MPSIEYELGEVENITKTLLSSLEKGIICFNGQMGTGKTTLIKALVKKLGAIDMGNSPTFSLVNEYHNADGELLAYHFDFYRIDSLEEALDIGLEDYFTSNVHIFIEWPEKIEDLLPEDYHKVSLYLVDENTRRIEY